MFPSQYVRKSLYNHGSSQKTEKINSSLVRRGCILANSIGWGLGHLKYFAHRETYFPRFELLLTRTCPFDCRCCIHFLPDYKDVPCEPAESVIADMEKLLSAVEQIDEVLISGGDAFTYPQLGTVVRFLASSEKIGKVTVISTGAVSPDPEITELLKDPKIQVSVDNYGKYSVKLDEFRSLSSPNVKVSCLYDTWPDFGDGSCRNRKPEELERQYASCKAERYCLLDGRVYACPRSAHGVNLGFVTDNEEEYVDLRKAADPETVLKGIRRLRGLTHLTACNHCNSCTEDFRIFGMDERYKN